MKYRLFIPGCYAATQDVYNSIESAEEACRLLSLSWKSSVSVWEADEDNRPEKSAGIYYFNGIKQ